MAIFLQMNLMVCYNYIMIVKCEAKPTGFTKKC